MNRLLALAILLVSIGLLYAHQLTDAEKADGFVPLFDGKTFDGWKTTELGWANSFGANRIGTSYDHGVGDQRAPAHVFASGS